MDLKTNSKDSILSAYCAMLACYLQEDEKKALKLEEFIKKEIIAEELFEKTKTLNYEEILNKALTISVASEDSKIQAPKEIAKEKEKPVIEQTPPPSFAAFF